MEQSEGEYAARVSPADQAILQGVTMGVERMVGRMERQVLKSIVEHALQHGALEHFKTSVVRCFSKDNPWHAANDVLAAIAKTEISSSDPAFFRKIMKELLYDACEPETVDDLIPTDMSVGGSPDRRDKAKCWDYNHGLCSKGVPGGNCGPTANKKHHLCDMKMMDGRQCSRKHRHIDHFPSLDYERALVVQSLLKLPNNKTLFDAIPENIKKLGPIVTSANTVVVVTNYMKDWAAARKNSLYSVTAYDGDDACSQKRTRFWDGKTWSQPFYVHQEPARNESTQDLSLSTVGEASELSEATDSSYVRPRNAVMVTNVISYDGITTELPGYKICTDQNGEKIWVKADATDENVVEVIGKGKGKYKTIESVLEISAENISTGPGATSTPAKSRKETIQEILENQDLHSSSNVATAKKMMSAAKKLHAAAARLRDQVDSVVDNTNRQEVGATLEEVPTMNMQEASPAANNVVPMDSSDTEAGVQESGQVIQQKEPEVELYKVHQKEIRQQTSGDASAAIDNADEKDFFYSEAFAAHNVEDLGRALTVHTAGKASRPVYSQGAPDFSCPGREVEYTRLRGPNTKPVLPAGIRRGDPMLPNDLLYRNAPHWNLGQCPFPHANTNFARYMKMAATEDQFVCVTPLPVLKGVSFSYKEFREARQCLQCDKETRVGVLFVHTNDETTRDIKNHWHCESCITESVLNLPPSSICITCLTVPKKLFYSSPAHCHITKKTVSEGFRRNVMSRGGREVMTTATLAGHLSIMHLHRTGRLLQWVDDTKSEDDLINYQKNITFGEERRLQAEAAANNVA